MKKTGNDPDMLDEYDFSKGKRGRYAERYAEGANVVVIDPDLIEFFPDHDSVNDALRNLTEIIKRTQKVGKTASRQRSSSQQKKQARSSC
ncbi:MAG: hypothetical protein AB9903_30040 [Vulcanimicrobiota bacterium]